MKILKRKTLAALLALSLLASLLPLGAQPALAVDTAPQTLYVGSTIISTGYWTSSDGGKVWTSPADEPEGNNYIYYDGQGTLKLHNVTIQGADNTGSPPYGAGIYALCSQDQPVALTIELIGENTITGNYGIYVDAQQGGTVGTNASLLIQNSDDDGSLEVSGSSYGIYVKSGTGDASLTIKNASVDAKTTQIYSSYAGVCVQSGASTTDSPNISLSVNGGSLTASASEGNDGIQFYVGNSSASATTSLTVSENAIVDARNGGISASRSSVTLPTPKPTGNNSSGIVFDGSAGTVYGAVTLQEDLTIGEGESLKLASGASLNANVHNVIVMNGGLVGEGLAEKLSGNLIDENALSFPESLTLKYVENQIAMYSVGGYITLDKNIALNGDGKLVIYGSYGKGKSGFALKNEENGQTATVTISVTDRMGDRTNLISEQTQALAVLDANNIDDCVLAPLYEGANEAKLPPGTYKGNVVLYAGYTTKKVTAGAEVTDVDLDKLWKYEIPVTLTLPTLITKQPENQNVIEGEEATFSVTASGKGSLEYQWQRSIDAGKKWTNISGATSSACTIEDTTTNMNGQQYRCVVCSKIDGVVETSEVAMLTVAAASYNISVDPSALDFGSITEGEERPAAQTVTVKNTGNQTVTLNPPAAENFEIGKLSETTLEPDETAAFTIQPKENLPRGSYSEQITITDSNNVMLKLTASFTVKEPPYTGKYSYELTTSVGDHGSLTVDRYATEGEKVTITVTPDEAYLLDDLVVTAGGKDVELVDNGDGTYTFTMPSADVRITATFAEDPDWTEPEEPATDVSDLFIDIAPNAWYKDAVQYAYDNGLMTGVSATEFAPEATTTRAMIVSILARLENVTTAEAAGFADVDDNDWYATAVNWAAGAGVVNGYEDNTFRSNQPITREQLAAILMNYAQYKGQDVSARATLDTYNDATAISSWANDVMSWAVAEGLLTGVTNDQLQPQGNATRAQVAAILERFLDN